VSLGLKGGLPRELRSRGNWLAFDGSDSDAAMARQAAAAPGEAPFPWAFVTSRSDHDPAYQRRHPDHSTLQGGRSGGVLGSPWPLVPLAADSPLCPLPAVLAPIPWEWFARWQGSPVLKRGDEYEAFKAGLANQLLMEHMGGALLGDWLWLALA
jgi:hypothetical protein